MANPKSEEYNTKAPKNGPQMTVDNDGRFPNRKHYPGDSVDGHERMETANAIIAKGEIGQQNENL